MTMSTVLNFPELDESISMTAAQTAAAFTAGTALAVPTIKDATLAQFTRTEAALRLVAEKWRAVVFAVDTPKGLADARAARNELRESGRYAVQRAEKRVKDEVNDLKRAVADEAERLIAIVKPVEDAIDQQITAREAALAAEKAERDRIEAERVAKHRAGIERIRGYVAQAQGKTAAQIEAGLQTLLAMRFDDSANFEEFAQEASQEMHSTLEALRHLRDVAQAREAEAARIEAQRVENARVAAELAAERQKIDAENEAMRLRAAAFQAERDAARAESDRLERLAEERRAAIIAAQNSQRQESASTVALADQNPVVDAGAAKAEGEGASAPSPGSLEQDAPADKGNVPLPAAAGAYAGNEAQAAQASPSGSGDRARADECAPNPQGGDAYLPASAAAVPPEDDDAEPATPVVRNAPKRIWLCVGDLEHDDDFAALRDYEIAWCDAPQGPSDIEYVLVPKVRQS